MPVSPTALRGCRLFTGLPNALIERAGERMTLSALRRREVLGGADPFRGLGILLSGRMQAVDQTIDGREVAMVNVEAGDCFGHFNVMATHPVELTWVASTAATVGLLGPADARALLAEPAINARLAADMAQQICTFLGWQKIQSVHPVSSRVCAWLLWQAQMSETVLLPTHAELAWRLNTTRESVTRVLQRLQAEGLLRREQEVWRILDFSRLRELASGESSRGFPG